MPDPFPTPRLLDSGARADENPLDDSGGWAAAGVGVDPCRLVAHWITCQDETDGISLRKETFDGAQGGQVTVAALGSSGGPGLIALWDTQLRHYLIVSFYVGDGIYVDEFTGTSQEFLGRTPYRDLEVGDDVGWRYRDGTFYALVNDLVLAQYQVGTGYKGQGGLDLTFPGTAVTNYRASSEKRSRRPPPRFLMGGR